MLLALIIMQFVIVTIMVTLIMLVKPTKDAISGIGSGYRGAETVNSNPVSGVSKVIITIALLFIANSIMLAAVNNRTAHNTSVGKQIEKLGVKNSSEENSADSVPSVPFEE